MKFSVVIPIHNKLPHLERSINSVLNQTFQDFEILLIDDASTDGSSEKIKEFKDPRISIFTRNEPGPGGYAARNLGIEKAKGEWIAFLDADDEWHTDMLSTIADVMQKEKSAELIACNWIIRREGKQEEIVQKEKKRKSEYTDFMLIDYLNNPKYVWTGAVVCHKALIDKAGAFPDGRACKRGGDVDTWIRWLDASTKNIYIYKVLSYYYQDTINQVTSKPNKVFCAYNSIRQIYLREKDPSLRKAIKRFNNKFVYNMLARQVKAGMPIDYSAIQKMYLNEYSLLRVAKLHVIRLKNIVIKQ